MPVPTVCLSVFFFFNDTATTEIYTLSLHDALPIYERRGPDQVVHERLRVDEGSNGDRKSTRLNSSHGSISYAVFCLKKNKQKHHPYHRQRPFPDLVFTQLREVL